MRHSFVELSTLNIALLGRQPKFSKNPTFPFVFLLYFISFWFNLIFFFMNSWFVLICLICVSSVSGSGKKVRLGFICL